MVFTVSPRDKKRFIQLCVISLSLSFRSVSFCLWSVQIAFPVQSGRFQHWSKCCLITCEPLFPSTTAAGVWRPFKSPGAGVCALPVVQNSHSYSPPSPLLSLVSNSESNQANSEQSVSDKNRTWCPCVPKSVNAQLCALVRGFMERLFSLLAGDGIAKNEAIYHSTESRSH